MAEPAGDIAGQGREPAGEAVLGVGASLDGWCWRARPVVERTALAIARTAGVSQLTGRLMAARGITPETAPAWLAPTLRDAMPDPAHLLDMDRGVARILAAIEAGERITIFGDYDVDGATSTALLLRWFAGVGVKAGYYIPDRLAEGYGPNADAMRKLKNQGTDLVITVDCGVTAHEPLAAARDAGLDVIVVDHHAAEHQLPPAHAIINPNRLDQHSEHGNLAAVGVTFLLLVALNKALREKGRDPATLPDLMACLDIAALGTICDVVPLTGFNRALAARGLQVMAGRTNPGLAILGDIAGIREAPEAFHAGFMLGPRINAGGRVGRSDLGTRLLAGGEDHELRAIALELDRLNAGRREIEKLCLDQALAGLSEQGLAKQGGGDDVPMVMAAGEGWHPGVIGIVASRLKDRYRRPAAVIAFDENGMGKASARSVRGVDLGAAVIAARQEGLLINGGGHAMAAGFTVARDAFPEFQTFMMERIGPALANAPGRTELNIDAVVSPGGLTMELAQEIARLGPFGAGNAEPRIAVADARIIDPGQVGENHVRCMLTGQHGGARVKAIAFRALDNEIGPALLSAGGRPVHLVGKLKIDRWNGEERPSLQIEDAAFA